MQAHHLTEEKEPKEEKDKAYHFASLGNFEKACLYGKPEAYDDNEGHYGTDYGACEKAAHGFIAGKHYDAAYNYLTMIPNAGQGIVLGFAETNDVDGADLFLSGMIEKNFNQENINSLAILFIWFFCQQGKIETAFHFFKNYPSEKAVHKIISGASSEHRLNLLQKIQETFPHLAETALDEFLNWAIPEEFQQTCIPVLANTFLTIEALRTEDEDNSMLTDVNERLQVAGTDPNKIKEQMTDIENQADHLEFAMLSHFLLWRCSPLTQMILLADDFPKLILQDALGIVVKYLGQPWSEDHKTMSSHVLNNLAFFKSAPTQLLLDESKEQNEREKNKAQDKTATTVIIGFEVAQAPLLLGRSRKQNKPEQNKVQDKTVTVHAAEAVTVHVAEKEKKIVPYVLATRWISISAQEIAKILMTYKSSYNISNFFHLQPDEIQSLSNLVLTSDGKITDKPIWYFDIEEALWEYPEKLALFQDDSLSSTSKSDTDRIICEIKRLYKEKEKELEKEAQKANNNNGPEVKR